MGDSDDSNSDKKEKPVNVVFSVQSVESTLDPPMEEWSSLEVIMEPEKMKKQLYLEGLYDPGDGELCANYITMSASSMFRHPYYAYPAIIDPGIEKALLEPEDIVMYPDDGQALYLALCKDMNQCPVRIFHRGLLTTHIDLRYYCIDPFGFRPMAKALQRNTNVQLLNLTDNFLNDDACYHMGDMLLTNKTITEINLRGCRIGPEGARRLFSLLVKNKTLKVLDLSRNKLGDQGMEHLASAVLFGLGIRRLNLSYNDITGKGFAFFVEPFETHNKFTHLDLSWNKLYSVGGAVFLTALATSDCLQVLDLSWNSLSGPRIANAVKAILLCPLLSELNLSNNKLDKEAITIFTGSLTKAKKLVTLNLSFNPLTPSDALKVLTTVAMVAAKVRNVLMDNVDVGKDFVTLLETTKMKKSKENLVVTYGDVVGTFKAKGADKRELVLNRVEYLTSRNKKSKANIALIALQLQKENCKAVISSDFLQYLKRLGVSLDETLVDELGLAFPAPSTNPKIKVIDINLLVEYVKRKWPDRKLPVTPPPEPEPEPEPIPPPEEKVKGKGKKGKK